MIQFRQVTTGGGDTGESSLIGGERRRKDDLLFDTLGDLDELASFLGLAKAHLTETGRRDKSIFRIVQNDLIKIGALIATPKADSGFATLPAFTEKEVTKLEKLEQQLLKKTAIPERFILPGGNVRSAYVDVARTVCRRVERKIVSCIREQNLPHLFASQKYLNRLSDLLFILARKLDQ